MKKIIALIIMLAMSSQVAATDYIYCKSGELIRFAWVEMPLPEELGDVVLQMWEKGGEKGNLIGEILLSNDNGDIVAEFPSRNNQKDVVFKLSYISTINEAILVKLKDGRTAGDAITGTCKIEQIPNT